MLRVYHVHGSSAACVGVYGVGALPMANMPSAKVSVMEVLGETAVDFDFGPVEEHASVKMDQQPAARISSTGNVTNTSLRSFPSRTMNRSTIYQAPTAKLVRETRWPLYILYGNGEIYVMTVILGDKLHQGLHGPHHINPKPEGIHCHDFCSILCIPSTPPILSVAHCSGKICHVLVLPSQSEPKPLPSTDSKEPDLPFLRQPNKTLLLLEIIELELGISTTPVSVDYSCPLMLHRDISKLGNYYATHEGGVHTITIPCVDKIHKFLAADQDIEDEVLLEIAEEVSTVEYIICTRITTSQKVNPVIGFAIFYDPHSILVLLSSGKFVSLAVLNAPLPRNNYLDGEGMENMTSPLKKMLRDPFDAQIQRILKQSNTQPILMLADGAEHTQQECYELLQRADKVFRDEHFKHNEKAREEIEKRVKALRMLKDFQVSEIDRMNGEKQQLQDNAESLAEKYEDLKDKQDDLSRRCEKMLKMISMRQTVPSTAEKHYHQQLKDFERKVDLYTVAITKLRNKIKYQEIQMENWQKHNERNLGLGSEQAEAVKENLQDSTNKIMDMVNEVNEHKRNLNIRH